MHRHAREIMRLRRAGEREPRALPDGAAAAQVDVEPGLARGHLHVERLGQPDDRGERLRHRGRRRQPRREDGTGRHRHEIVAARHHEAGTDRARDAPHMQDDTPATLAMRVDERPDQASRPARATAVTTRSRFHAR